MIESKVVNWGDFSPTNVIADVSNNLPFADNLIEEVTPRSLQVMADCLRRTQATLAMFKKAVSELTELQDNLRYGVIPDRMDEEGLQSMNIKGIGTLYLTAEVLVSTKQAMGPDLQDWLRENGFDDLITETVNSSTLAAFMRERMEAGLEIPMDFLNILPRTRAAIKKS